MAARKRKSNESFKQYREELKEEALILKQRLKGTVLWASDKLGTARKQMTPTGYVYTNGRTFVKL